MKFLVILALFMVNATLCCAQQAVVSSDRMNILYAGVENSLSVAVENVSNKSLVVKATNGTVEKVAQGKYSYTGSKLGIDEILIFKKNKSGLKKVGIIPFNVQSLPDPITFVGGLPKGGSIRKKLAFPQGGIIARLENAGVEAPIRIDTYTVTVIKTDSCDVKNFFNHGSRFNESVVAAFQALHVNDIVIFKNIYVIMPDGNRRKILPLFLTMEE